MFEFLDPGEQCENIRPREKKQHTEVPDSLYDIEKGETYDEPSTSATPAKRGRRRTIQPLDEFFIVLCSLRRGFSERHLANLYGVSQ